MHESQLAVGMDGLALVDPSSGCKSAPGAASVTSSLYAPKEMDYKSGPLKIQPLSLLLIHNTRPL